MIDLPRVPPRHPDRVLRLEEAAEAEFQALAERMEAAGWKPEEADAALLSLAVNRARQRRATRKDEARISVMRLRSAM